MARLVVTAAASPLFGDFLMLVSVSKATDGNPVNKLKPSNFKIAHLASLNHAAELDRPVAKVTEGPDGFYILELAPNQIQPKLPAGHYIFAVAVHTGPKGPSFGQTIAVGDMV